MTHLIYDTEELKKTKQAILDAKKDNGYMCDYDKYNKQIERAYNNIKEYSDELDLISFLDELRVIRIKHADISSTITKSQKKL